MTQNKNMSPTVINLKESEDIRDVVHRVVQSLAEGNIVGVPTESHYCFVAAGTCKAAVERACALACLLYTSDAADE